MYCNGGIVGIAALLKDNYAYGRGLRVRTYYHAVLAHC